jgi:hypothetical protein
MAAAPLAFRARVRPVVKFLTLLSALTSLILATLPGMVLSAAAADPPISSFYDGTDGIIPDPGTGAAIMDMACGSGTDDFPINGASTKLGVIHNDVPPTITTGTLGTGKADLCNVWLDTEATSDAFFLYLAWERFSTEGSTIVLFEFHQAPLACTDGSCNPFSPRTPGDFMIVYDFEGNTATIYLREWNGTSFSAPVDLSALGYAEASLNADTSRGEAVVNLADAGILDMKAEVCESFAGVIPGTVTGNSDTADYKDVILTDRQPHISNCGNVTVEKVVTGGDDFGDVFPLTLARDSTTIRTESLGHSESFTEYDLFQGDGYSVTEDLTGLTGWTLDGIVCTLEGGATAGPSSDFLVEVNKTTTCVATNTPTLPTLELRKTVVNDDGGTATEDDFVPSIDDTEVTWDTPVTIDPGDHLASEEMLVTGYTAGPWGEDCEADGSLLGAELGGEYVCTITNDDEPGELILIKEIADPDELYPEATEDDFVPLIDESAGLWGSNEVDAGTYLIGEEDALGSSYLADGQFVPSYECDGEATNEVTVLNGETKTCTVTNTAVGAGLTIIKEVINDWGGTLEAEDFPLDVSGTTVESGVVTTLPAGNYWIGEEQQPGYEFVSFTCEGTEPTPLEDGRFEVGVAAGDSAVCTFVNQDVPATLVLEKTVVNDDGGTATQDDFTPSVDEVEVDWDTPVLIGVGDHVTAETTLPGYAAGDWGGDCDAEGVLEGAELAGEYVCTITNDDIAPTVTLRKVVVNDDGGTATQDDFTPLLDDEEVDWDVAYDIVAGEHVAGEVAAAGYLAGDWAGDCAPDGTLDAEIGESYECMITNDDLPAGLTATKVVVNDDGGTLGVTDFPLTVTPQGDDPVVVTSGTETIVAAGTYTITETQQAGYALTGMACSDGTSLAAGATSVTVTVGLDESVLCTVTNDDLPIGIQVVKVADDTTVTFDPANPPVVTYTYFVTNTGETTLTDVTLVDDVLGPITLADTTLEPGELVIGTATHTVTAADATAGEIVNIAVVTGDSPDGRTATDDDTETVDVDVVQVLPAVIPAPAPVLPVTGADTFGYALWAALLAALGALFLLLVDDPRVKERRRVR